MISKQEITDFLSEGMRIAVTVILKNEKEIEFVREDENDYNGFLSEYRYNQAALDKLFEKATDGQGILEGLKSIDEYFLYWDLTDREVEQLNEEFNSIHSIDDVTKIVIQEATVYDPSMGVDYEKYEYCFTIFNEVKVKKENYYGVHQVHTGKERVVLAGAFGVTIPAGYSYCANMEEIESGLWGTHYLMRIVPVEYSDELLDELHNSFLFLLLLH